MAISSNGLAGLKPGVVDSTATRPASPFEGQMIFQKDTDQLLVWNGTAWVIPNSPAQNPTGLEFIKSQTVGTAVSSVTVTNAFSTDYDNYRIIYTGGTGSGTVSMTIGGNVTSTYSNSLIYGTLYGTPTPAGIGASAGAAWTFVGYCDANLCHVGLDVFSPNLAKYTTFGNCSYSASTNAGNNSGIHAVATAFTSFALIPAGTFTGGTITVYGYRK